MPNPIVNYLHDEEEVGIFKMAVSLRRDRGLIWLTQGMATAELWLLGVLCSKLISNAVEQLDVTLLWVLL
jgi:hypothetical protein